MRKSIYLLSGLLCDEMIWAYQAQALAVDYDVHIVSFQGLDSFSAMAEKVLSQAPSSFALAGHSMGGRVAMEVYRRAPMRVERLALLDTGYEAASTEEAAKRAVLVEQACKFGMAAIAENWSLPMLAPARRTDQVLLNSICGMVGRMSAEIYAGQVGALLARFDTSDVLKSVRCPTMFICGRQDGWSPPERHAKMAALVAHSELRLIDDCGHMSTLEQPHSVLCALQEWLALPSY